MATPPDRPVPNSGGGGAGAGAWTPPTWEEIVRTHADRVYRLALRLSGNVHDAEDLTQEVFVRVFRSLGSYTPGTFEGWLHRITVNLFLDAVRRRGRVRMDGLPEDAAERLPGRELRAAVVLCDIEGLSYEEIAATLGVKLGTVRSRIHRGRTQLKTALAHRAPRPDAESAPNEPRREA